MIQIRNGIFETNSSSCHVFMIPKNTDIKIPKTVILEDECSADNMLNIYFNDINWGKDDIEPFIQFLYKCGVQEIRYNGRYSYVNDLIKKYKNSDPNEFYIRRNEESLKKVCFGTGIKLTTMEDYEVCEESVNNLGDFEDWYPIRLS